MLEEVARKQAERAGDMEIANMAADDPAMRSVLFSVVYHLPNKPYPFSGQHWQREEGW